MEKNLLDTDIGGDIDDAICLAYLLEEPQCDLIGITTVCGEAWDAISRYVYTALQGGSIMRNWTNDDRMMIACCNDGTRPVIFKIERIDIPETEEEKEWLEKQNFKNDASEAYTG